MEKQTSYKKNPTATSSGDAKLPLKGHFATITVQIYRFAISISGGAGVIAKSLDRFVTGGLVLNLSAVVSSAFSVQSPSPSPRQIAFLVQMAAML